MHASDVEPGGAPQTPCTVSPRGDVNAHDSLRSFDRHAATASFGSSPFPRVSSLLRAFCARVPGIVTFTDVATTAAVVASGCWDVTSRNGPAVNQSAINPPKSARTAGWRFMSQVYRAARLQKRNARRKVFFRFEHDSLHDGDRFERILAPRGLFGEHDGVRSA